MLKKLKEKGFFHIFGTNVINQIIAFCSGIILVRIFTQEDYGIYSFANSILSVFLIFNGIGTLSGMLQFGSENEKSQPKISNAYYKYGFKVGFTFDIVLTLAIILYTVFSQFPIKGVKMVLLTMSAIPLSLYVFESIKVNFRITEKDKLYSTINTINSMLILFFSVLGAILFNLYGVVLLKYIGYSISILLGLYFIKHSKKSLVIKHNLNKNKKREFIKFSLSTSANNAITRLLFSIDVIIIGIIIKDSNIIAVYKTATLIPYAFNFVPVSLALYLYPSFARNNNNKSYIRANYFKVLKYFSLFNLFVSLILVVFAPLIIKTIFGYQYIDSILPFRILSIGYFISSTFRTLSLNILTMLKKVKFILIINIVSLILNIIFNIVFVNIYGFIGASIATVIIFIISSFILTIYLLDWLNN